MEEENTQPDGPGIAMRACETCGSVKRLTPGNFPRVPGTQHTMRPVCRICYKNQKNKRAMDRMESNAASLFVKKAARGGSSIPHTSEMLESLMTLFGGSQGLASAMAQQYYAAPPGGRIRTSILEMIMRLVVKTAETGGTTKPTSLMTDDELESAITQRLENVVSAHKSLAYIQENGADQLLTMGNALTAADLKSMVPAIPHEPVAAKAAT